MDRPGNLAYDLQSKLEIARVVGPKPEFLLFNKPAGTTDLILHYFHRYEWIP